MTVSSYGTMALGNAIWLRRPTTIRFVSNHVLLVKLETNILRVWGPTGRLREFLLDDGFESVDLKIQNASLSCGILERWGAGDGSLR
jgi:hypothetical protein